MSFAAEIGLAVPAAPEILAPEDRLLTNEPRITLRGSAVVGTTAELRVNGAVTITGLPVSRTASLQPKWSSPKETTPSPPWPATGPG